MNSMGPCYSLLNMKVIRLNIVSAPPPIKMGREGGDLWQDKTLWVELKTNGGGVLFITILLHIHYFNSFESAKTQKS